MVEKRLKQAHGNWVEGDRFWDRESDIELLIGKLDEGAHILLMAQRRMGKTSLMKEMKRQQTGSKRETPCFRFLQSRNLLFCC